MCYTVDCWTAGGHVLALGNGTNMLGLMAAHLGARRVTCIEQGPMLYRIAKQTLQSNAHMLGVKHIVLVDKPLQACGIVGVFTPYSPQAYFFGRVLSQLLFFLICQ